MDLKWVLVLAIFLAFMPEIYAGCCQFSNGCDDADNNRACGSGVQSFYVNEICCSNGRCSNNGVCPTTPSSGSAPRNPTTTTPSSGSAPRNPTTTTRTPTTISCGSINNQNICTSRSDCQWIGTQNAGFCQDRLQTTRQSSAPQPQPPITTTTNSCPRLVTCNGVQVDLCSNRENCGECGNECEGPIDGGYCCSQARCVDSSGSTCGYTQQPTQPIPSSTKKTYNFKIQIVCDNNQDPTGYYSPFYKLSTDLYTNFDKNARFSMSQQNTYQLSTSSENDLVFGINTSSSRTNFISLGPRGNPPSGVSYVDLIEGIQVGHIVVNKDVSNNSIFEITFTAPEANCNSGTTIVRNTTTTTITGFNTTTSITNSTTTTLPENMVPFKVILKGDYDQSIEYSSVYLNGEKIGEACKTCSKTCEFQEGLEKNIDINQYCQDGFIDVKFVDTSTVDDFCNSVHKACIEIDGNEYCCEKECDMHGCENHVSFECDSFTCVELSDIIIKDFYCKDKSCGFRVKRNIIEKNISYVISAFNESDGKIYYSFTGSLGPKATGQFLRPLNVYRTCPNNMELSVIITFFDNNNNLLYVERLNRGFKC